MASSAHAQAQASAATSALLRSQRDTENLPLQLGEPVPHPGRFLSLECAGALQHLLLEYFDLARELLFRHCFVAHGLLDCLVVFGLVYSVDEILDALDHAFGRDAMALVVLHLFLAAPIRLRERALDGIGQVVGI